MPANVPRCLEERLQRTTAIAEKRLNKFIQVSLRYVDTSVEPWAKQISGLREGIKEIAFTEARITQAIATLFNDGTAHKGAQTSAERRDCATKKKKQLAEGISYDKIIHDAEPEGLLFRRELNRQLPIVTLPKQFISMILSEYVETCWVSTAGSRDEESPQNRRFGFVHILRLTHICSVWRRIAMSTTSIWCRLSLNWPPEAVSTFSIRSWGLNPKIQMSNRSELPRNAPLLLLERLPMTKEINLEIQRKTRCHSPPTDGISSYTTLAEVFEGLSHYPAPLLEELTLRYKDRENRMGTMPCAITDFFLANSRALHSLTLEGFPIPFLKDQTLLKGLRFLSLVCPGTAITTRPHTVLDASAREASWSDIHDFLSHTPDIERLKLEVVRARERSSDTTSTAVELIKCTHIDLLLRKDSSVSVSSTAASLQLLPTFFLSALSCPQLSTLSIKCRHIKRKDAFDSYADLPPYIHEFTRRAKFLHLSQDTGKELSAKLYLDPSAQESISIPYCSFTAMLDSSESEVREERYYFDAGRRRRELCEYGSAGVHPTIQSITNNLPSITPDTLCLNRLFFHDPHSCLVREKQPATLESCQALLRHYPSITKLIIHEDLSKTRENFIRALQDPLICPKLEELCISGDLSHLEEIKLTFSHRKANDLILKKLYLFADISYNYRIARQSDSWEPITLDCVQEFFTDSPDILERFSTRVGNVRTNLRTACTGIRRYRRCF
ncbi:hypothetical protein SISSUDRAFT_1131770 [Sistotremastrum suecicum HHB10207 ss-3]|uniref:F-box domain-containing protein n=1 Tax=Sistotremastrum suecicum HHB10207 ss-3 TaxID=1314776 RepID=A0A165ZRI8_9AGAM|nr:hypothetical protein SISSUDRAFT_1131770 [Sistotremastrum suecicum HHB10207 ss-3]